MLNVFLRIEAALEQISWKLAESYRKKSVIESLYLEQTNDSYKYIRLVYK